MSDKIQAAGRKSAEVKIDKKVADTKKVDTKKDDTKKVETKKVDKKEGTQATTSGSSEKLKYPTGVIIIYIVVMLERLSTFGMKNVQVLFFKNKLHFSEDLSTIIYHFISSLGFLSIFGAMLSDSKIGRYTSLLIAILAIVIGSTLMTLATIPPLHMPVIPTYFTGVLIRHLGTIIWPACITVFGASQFQLPQQQAALDAYFGIFYVAMNAAGLLAGFAAPFIRSEVRCFGEPDCYALVNALGTILVVLAMLVLVLAKKLFKIVPCKDNMVLKVAGCICYALRQQFSFSKRRRRTSSPAAAGSTRRTSAAAAVPQQRESKAHWLDHSIDRYGREMVEDVKILLRFVVLFIPFPIWFAMFEQISSRWTFQATRMAGKLGRFTIYPDMMHATNTLLVVLIVPIFQWFVYPAMRWCKMDTPVRRLLIGGLIMSAAFVVTGFLELAVRKTYPIVPGAGRGQLRLFNGASCDYRVSLDGVSSAASNPWTRRRNNKNNNSKKEREDQKWKDIRVRSYNFTQLNDVPVWRSAETVTLSAVPETTDTQDSACRPIPPSPILLSESGSTSVFLSAAADRPQVQVRIGAADKSRNGYPLLTVLGAEKKIVLRSSSAPPIDVRKSSAQRGKGAGKGGGGILNEDFQTAMTKADTPLAPGRYRVLGGGGGGDEGGEEEWEGERVVGDEVELLLGGVYTIMMKREGDDFVLLRVIEPNSIHILWQIPQYTLLTISEVMFIVTGMHLAFREAPESLKSVTQTVWILAGAAGNAIIMVVTQFKVHNRAAEFFAYAVAMALDMILLFFLALRYKPRNQDEPFL